MTHLSIQTSGFNTESLKAEHTVKSHGVGLYVYGMKRTRRIFPDGSEPNLPAFGINQPSLRLYVPGMRHIYEYEESRENWWVALEPPVPFEYNHSMREIIWNAGEYSFAIPAAIPLDNAEVPGMRMIFSQIHEKTLSGLPRDIIEAELMLAGVLVRFLQQKKPSADTSDCDIPEKLRRLIDNDEQEQYSLEELCAMVGVGRDFGRKCFFERYRILPGDYRRKRRIAQILNLLNSTDLSLKEIAYRYGISHQAYLSALIREKFQLTPTELRQIYRCIKK